MENCCRASFLLLALLGFITHIYQKMTHIKGCIFDLDGVIVDTAKYHYKAWRKLANHLGFDFSEADNEQLKGVSRIDSLNIILNLGGITKSEDEIQELASMKNDWYVEMIADMNSSELLPGALAFLQALKKANIRIALGSASKNAPRILDSTGITHYFQSVIDGNKTTKGKPDPQVFELGATELGLHASECVVFEDAQKGVEAAKNGGFHCVGIGSPIGLGQADFVISGLHEMTVEMLDKFAPVG